MSEKCVNSKHAAVYSITSSARASSGGGTWMPSALACHSACNIDPLSRGIGGFCEYET
jgi:hypothetical protein